LPFEENCKLRQTSELRLKYFTKNIEHELQIITMPTTEEGVL